MLPDGVACMFLPDPCRLPVNDDQYLPQKILFMEVDNCFLWLKMRLTA